MSQNRRWANSQLRFGILIAKGKGCYCPDNVRFGILLDICKDLFAGGFWWQAKIMRAWVHRWFKGSDYKPDSEHSPLWDQVEHWDSPQNASEAIEQGLRSRQGPTPRQGEGGVS